MGDSNGGSDVGLVTVTVQPAWPTVCLFESDGVTGIAGAWVQYYAGGWQEFGISEANGCVSKDITPGMYSFRIHHAGATVDKQQDLTNDSMVIFQTVNSSIQLQDSLGNPLEAENTQYYASGWKTFGAGATTDGQVSMELLPKNYSFRTHYAGASIDKQQDIAGDPIIVFQTVNALLQLQDSLGNPLEAENTQYYASGWKTFGAGATTGGQISMELLPKSYSFRVHYAGASIDKQQDIAGDSIVVFQTVIVSVQLQDSQGNLTDADLVEYYAGGWKTFGSGTTTNGQVNMELLPRDYSFRAHYDETSEDKNQDVDLDPLVIFQTATAPPGIPTVCLYESDGVTGIADALAQYYAGGWQDFGITGANGCVEKDLLPGTYSFRIHYAGASIDKGQDIDSNAAVIFQTTNTTVQLQDSQGSSLEADNVQYYAAGWKTFGSGVTAGGQVSMELLSKRYSFRMHYAGASTDLLQQIDDNPVVLFQTGRVSSATGSCTQYYASGWRPFVNEMELLPNGYTFRFDDGTADTSYEVIAGISNGIH